MIPPSFEALGALHWFSLVLTGIVINFDSSHEMTIASILTADKSGRGTLAMASTMASISGCS